LSGTPEGAEGVDSYHESIMIDLSPARAIELK